MKGKKVDLMMMILFPVVATITTLVLRTNLLISIFLYFGVPSLYIVLKNPKIMKKSIVFAFVFSIPLSLFVDNLAAVNGAWEVPESLFPVKFFGIATVEVYFFGLMWVFLTILMYEYFFDRHKHGNRIPTRIKYLLYIFSLLIFFVTIAFFTKKSWLLIPYYYLFVGVIFVIAPLIVFLYYHPEFMSRFVDIGFFFFFVLLAFELTALEVGQWIFPGRDFIGFVDIKGYRFPIEELFIWMIAATPSLLCYYEYFADDTKLTDN